MPDLLCQQHKLQISELVNATRKSAGGAKRYFCMDSFFGEKKVPDFFLPGNFLQKKAKLAQVSLCVKDAHAS